MMRLFAYVVAGIVAVLAVGTISPRWADYSNREAVLLFGLILGLINFFVRPILKVITFPLSCLTFGLFALVLNAALFALASRLTDGVDVSAWGAIFGSIIASIASGIIYSLVDEE